MPLGFIWHFQDMHCVAFVENALFKSSGDICWPPLPSSLLDELSMDKIDSDSSFSRRVVCRSSDRSYYSIDSSLVIVNCQTMLLCLEFSLCVLNLLIWHTCVYYVIVCTQYLCILVVTLHMCIAFIVIAGLACKPAIAKWKAWRVLHSSVHSTITQPQLTISSNIQGWCWAVQTIPSPWQTR